MPDGESTPAPIRRAPPCGRPADDERSVDEMLAAGDAPVEASVAEPVINRDPDPTPEPRPVAEPMTTARPGRRRSVSPPPDSGAAAADRRPEGSSAGAGFLVPHQSRRLPHRRSFPRHARAGWSVLERAWGTAEQQCRESSERPALRRGGNPGMPGSRGPAGPGRGPSGPGRGPAGRGGGRPGFGGPANGSGRGPSNGPPRGGPRKRSR